MHNAGVPSFGPLEPIASPAQMQQVLQTNLLAPMLLTQALLPHLRRLPRAQVICVGSALGRIGLPGFSVYGASKFGLRGFAEALRRELADTPVRVQYPRPAQHPHRFQRRRLSRPTTAPPAPRWTRQRPWPRAAAAAGRPKPPNASSVSPKAWQCV